MNIRAECPADELTGAAATQAVSAAMDTLAIPANGAKAVITCGQVFRDWRPKAIVIDLTVTKSPRYKRIRLRLTTEAAAELYTQLGVVLQRGESK